jgi:transcriptional repressor NrdR
VGLAILGPLRELDEVAYLRFASVYRGFESLADFEEEIATLRSGREQRRRGDDQDGESPADGARSGPTRADLLPAGSQRAPAKQEQRTGAR